MNNLEKLLLQLLSFDSISGKEERIGRFIFDRLKKIGDFKLKKQLVNKKRFNIIAKKGNSDIWLIAHMDTVPGVIPIKNGKTKVYGRGAVDNKGNIAGIIAAASKMKDINLMFTAGEETDFSGAKKAKQIVGNDKAVIFEPVDFEIYTSQRGVIDFYVEIKGEQKHSSFLQKGESFAFLKMVELLHFFKKQGWTAFNIGMIEGGLAPNIVAGKVLARLSARPENDKEFMEIIKKLESLKQNKKLDIKIINSLKPFESEINLRGKKIGCFTEMSFFPNSLLFGAGDLRLAHSDRENIKKQDLRSLPNKIIELVSRIREF